MDREVSFKKEFSINKSADENNLQNLILEEIKLRRLRKVQTKYDAALNAGRYDEVKKMFDPTSKIDSSIERISKLLKLLGGDRRSRGTLKTGSNKGDIASLVEKFDRFDGQGVNFEDEEENEQEIGAFMVKSKERQEEELRKLGIS